MSKIKIFEKNRMPILHYFHEIPVGSFFREGASGQVRLKLSDTQVWFEASGKVEQTASAISTNDCRYVLLDVEIHVKEAT